MRWLENRFGRAAMACLVAIVAVGAAETPVASGSSAANSVDTEAAIFDRQFLMQQLDDDGEVLGNISAGIEPVSKLAATTRSIANNARDSVESFRAVIPGGQSKPEVWSNHADFMVRMEAFAKSAEAMAKAGSR